MSADRSARLAAATATVRGSAAAADVWAPPRAQEEAASIEETMPHTIRRRRFSRVI
jgi:hypothetical protein